MLKKKIFFFNLSSSPLGFPGCSVAKNLPANTGDVGLIAGLGRSREKEMATHSSILTWEIPWTEEPGGDTVHGVAEESDTTDRPNNNK